MLELCFATLAIAKRHQRRVELSGRQARTATSGFRATCHSVPRSLTATLIPEELVEREHINTAHAAATLAIPADELADVLAAANVSRDMSPANAHV